MKRPSYPTPNSSNNDPSPQRREAFQKAYIKHYKGLVAVIHGMTGDWEQSQDIAQDTWTHAYKNFKTEQFDHMGLLVSKARQILVDKHRYNKTRSFLGFTDNVEKYPIVYRSRDFIGTADEETRKSRMLEEFQQAFLDDTDKELFWLRFQYGYTIKELSQQFGIPISTLHDRLDRIREICQQILSNS